MLYPKQQTVFRAVLYGGASVLLAFDLFFLAKSLFLGNFIPLVPIIAGIFTALGLLFIVYAEHRSRLLDKEDHRRLTRVAHQLETPLNSLQDSLASLIQQSDTLPSEARLKLKHMETKSKTLLENVRDVFLTLRASEGTIAQEKRVYDLCVVAKDVITAQRPLVQARNVELTYQNHCQKAPVKIDRQLFKIALTHLIENASLYTLTPGLVNITVNRGQKHVRVVVQDRGVGLTKADQAVIFEPFARGQKADQFDPDGIGIGLTLARLIIRELGGDLRYVPRQPKAGSQFEIILPLNKTSAS